MSFLEEYDKNFALKLGIRAETLRKIFEELEKKNKEFYLIVETGCVRTTNGYGGDGMSTVLFDEFVNFHDGMVVSVDINRKNCELAQSMTSNKTIVHCSDSIDFLNHYTLSNEIDLLYLDSLDIDFSNPYKSAQHHMNEFNAIKARLEKGTIIVVDDYKSDESGKGMYIAKYMRDTGYKRFIDDYQIGWVL
jgi:hypothetical protein